jgi:hypothetical protein
MPLPIPTFPAGDTVALLREWGRLTRAEAAAIAAQDWDTLRAHQDEKAALRLRLEQVLHSPTDTPSTSEAARKLASELCALEEENRTQLATEINKVKALLADEGRSLHTLGQVRKVYAGPSHSHWGTYG